MHFNLGHFHIPPRARVAQWVR